MKWRILIILVFGFKICEFCDVMILVTPESVFIYLILTCFAFCKINFLRLKNKIAENSKLLVTNR